MDSRFNSLERDERYTFVFGQGIEAISGVFHGITADGCLKVAGYPTTDRTRTAQLHRLNPDLVVYAREES